MHWPPPFPLLPRHSCSSRCLGVGMENSTYAVITCSKCCQPTHASCFGAASGCDGPLVAARSVGSRSCGSISAKPARVRANGASPRLAAQVRASSPRWAHALTLPSPSRQGWAAAPRRLALASPPARRDPGGREVLSYSAVQDAVAETFELGPRKKRNRVDACK